jgi:hypothetical protein
MYQPHYRGVKSYSKEAITLLEAIIFGPNDMPEEWQRHMAKYINRLTPQEKEEFFVLMADLQTGQLHRTLKAVLGEEAVHEQESVKS